jgi:PP-loop superfamily ATP-utilizing enzyme
MIFVQRRIKKIMTIKDRDKRETAFSSTYTPDGKHIEEEVIRRIQEAARSIRESRLWLIALMSAIASVFSALAAWFAVFRY